MTCNFDSMNIFKVVYLYYQIDKEYKIIKKKAKLELKLMRMTFLINGEDYGDGDENVDGNTMSVFLENASNFIANQMQSR